jgi:predicted ATPase
MSKRLPSGTVTLLFTDIEGSTRLLRKLEAGYAEALAGHRRLLRDAFAKHGGVEVDTQGDALLVAFANAADAVIAAEDGQAALAGGQIAVRMGIHTGLPDLTGEGYVGLDLHLGARIGAAGHGGQVLMSKATADLVGARAELADLGEHRLKDFPEPVWLYQLGRTAFPPLRTISNTNLPRSVSTFIGREREIAGIKAVLFGGARLVTLTGPGGTGKTRLAIETAASLMPEFRNGVFWIDLAALRDPTLVMGEIGRTIGARDDLSEHIGERQMLLVLDNLEQLVDAAPEVAALLAKCPNLAVLATSREVLRIGGEAEFPVPVLAGSEAVTLFAERSGLSPSPEAAELCRRLDNLPLAVELAAARASVLSVAQITARLADRLDLFKGGRDADPRQRTLRATIEWSHDLLSVSEQRLFRALSVFAGGWALEAAEDVCGADIDTLQSLADKSLINHVNERFGMLESIREYAAARLAESDDLGIAHRHGRWFAELAERAEPLLEGGDQKVWLDRLELENDNIRCALSGAIAGGDGELALRLAAAVATFWWIHGHWNEGRRWFELALGQRPERDTLRVRALEGAAHLAQRQLDLGLAEQMAREALSISTELGDSSRTARVLRILGLTATAAGDRDRFRTLTEQSADAGRASGDDWALLMAQMNLGYARLEDGDSTGAIEFFDDALALAAGRGDERSQSHVLENRAWAWVDQGHLDRARADFGASLRLAHVLNFTEIAAEDLSGIAAILAARGELAEAALTLSGAQHLREQIGSDADTVENAMEERTVAAIERGLAQPEREAASAAGRKLDLDGLVARALG